MAMAMVRVMVKYGHEYNFMSRNKKRVNEKAMNKEVSDDDELWTDGVKVQLL